MSMLLFQSSILFFMETEICEPNLKVILDKTVYVNEKTSDSTDRGTGIHVSDLF